MFAAFLRTRAYGVRGGMPASRPRLAAARFCWRPLDYQRLGDAAIKVNPVAHPSLSRDCRRSGLHDVAGCTHLFGPPAELPELSAPCPGGALAFRFFSLAWRAPKPSRVTRASGQARRASGCRSRHRTGLPSRSARRTHCGRQPVAEERLADMGVLAPVWTIGANAGTVGSAPVLGPAEREEAD